MRDEDKSKEQLINELAGLRRQMAQLKGQRAKPKPIEKRQSVRVGEILIEMGCLTKSQLDEALRKQKEADTRGESHVPVGKILVQSGVIIEEDLQTALAEQLRRINTRHK